jgi:hypothetical protein
MKTKIIAFIIGCLTLFTACENDGDMIKVGGLESSELLGDGTTDLVLSEANYSTQVLAFAWSESNLTISDTTMSLPSSIPSESLEVSATNDFKVVKKYKSLTGTFAFTGATLNALAKDLGLPVDVANPIYFRINTALGANTDPVYSNVVAVNVTSYFIDMSFGFILNADKEKTAFTLASPNSDGIYGGFTGVTAWYNWYLLEGNGVRWGTANNGTTGTPFQITSEDTQWNNWYPGITGCYYTTLNTNTKEWTATNIPSLTVRGSDTTEMKFVRAEVKWIASFKTKTANEVVKVRCDAAKLYNISTGTDDTKAVTKTIGFLPGSGINALAFEWGSEGSDITITGAAGDYTLTFYLSDPKALRYEVKSGIDVPVEPISNFLYLPGIDDGLPGGSWNFNQHLSLLSADDSTFAGTVNVNSKYGYNMSLISGEWTNVYKMGATGDAASGTLAFKGSANIPAPATGLTLIQADVKKLTYSHTAISNVYYTGLNDDWSLKAFTATSKPGVFTADATINAASPWGCKFYIDSDWKNFYGGSAGKLAFKGANIVDDATIAAGNYTIIADLISQTYAFLGDKVYIVGLNDKWNFTDVVLSKTSAGVYTGTAVISAPSSYGIKIHIDQSWNRFYGGTLSSLSYSGSEIPDVKTLANGTYTVTVDFINNNCTFVAVP